MALEALPNRYRPQAVTPFTSPPLTALPRSLTELPPTPTRATLLAGLGSWVGVGGRLTPRGPLWTMSVPTVELAPMTEADP